MHKLVKSTDKELKYRELKVGEEMILSDTGELIVGTRGGYFKFDKDGELLYEEYNTIAPSREYEYRRGFIDVKEECIDTSQVDLHLHFAKSFLLRDLIKTVDYDDSVFITLSEREEGKFYNVKELTSDLLQKEVVEVYPSQCESLGIVLK